MLNHDEFYKMRSMVRMFILTKRGKLFLFMGSISIPRQKKTMELPKKTVKLPKK